MKRWYWKRWAWTGVFGITAAVGLALGAGKDAPSASAPPKVGDIVTLKFQKGGEKHVKILKTERRPDGSYQSEVKDTKTGEVFTLVDKSHMAPPSASSSPARQAATPRGIDSKKPALNPPEPSIRTPAVKAPTGDFSPKAKTTFADPLLMEAGGAADGSSKERRLFGSSKPNTAASPAPMPEPTPEPHKKPGLLKRLFGKESAPSMPATPTPPQPPSTAPVLTPKPVHGAPTPAFVPSNSVFEPGPGAKRTTTTPAPTFAPSVSAFDTGPAARRPAKAAPAFTPSNTALEPGASATQPAPRVGAGTATIGSPGLFPGKASTNEPPRGNAPKSNSPTTEPRPAPVESVKPPKPVIPAPVTPPSAPPSSAPLPVPTPPATIPAPVVTAPNTPAPRTTVPVVPAPSSIPSTPAIPVVPATPVIPAVPSTPGLPSIPALPGGMSARQSTVMQAAHMSRMTTAAAALAHDIQPDVTTLRTAAAPSARAMAAKALAGSRHGSTDSVKSILFIACTTDPSPFVRACCIDELCKLGYFEPKFMAHLHKACADESEEVRTAAKEALKKMTPGK